jgi:hypothetical protein
MRVCFASVCLILSLINYDVIVDVGICFYLCCVIFVLSDDFFQLLAISCVALTPDGVRSALIAGGVRVTATMFTCEPTYLFGDGNFGCANNNVYYLYV